MTSKQHVAASSNRMISEMMHLPNVPSMLPTNNNNNNNSNNFSNGSINGNNNKQRGEAGLFFASLPPPPPSSSPSSSSLSCSTTNHRSQLLNNVNSILDQQVQKDSHFNIDIDIRCLSPTPIRPKSILHVVQQQDESLSAATTTTTTTTTTKNSSSSSSTSAAFAAKNSSSFNISLDNETRNEFLRLFSTRKRTNNTIMNNDHQDQQLTDIFDDEDQDEVAGRDSNDTRVLLHNSLHTSGATAAGSTAAPPISSSLSSQHGNSSNSNNDDDTSFSNPNPTTTPFTTTGPIGASYKPEKWLERYEELVLYRKQYGNTLVPHNWIGNRTLAQWVKRQRYQYKLKYEGKHTTLTNERQQLLEGIDFIWSSHHAAWEDKYQQLKQFKLRYGHCNVPTSTSTISNSRQDNPYYELSVWMKCQRRHFFIYTRTKEGGGGGGGGGSKTKSTTTTTTMTQERVMKLLSLGVSFENPNSNNHKKKIKKTMVGKTPSS